MCSAGDSRVLELLGVEHSGGCAHVGDNGGGYSDADAPQRAAERRTTCDEEGRREEDAACQPGRAAGALEAAHSGTDRGFRVLGVDPRCSCAACGGPVGGRPEDHRHVAACCCRAGDRSAQD